MYRDQSTMILAVCIQSLWWSITAKFHYASWFGASSEPASLVEFGCNSDMWMAGNVTREPSTNVIPRHHKTSSSCHNRLNMTSVQPGSASVHRCNTVCYLAPTRVHTANDISISSADSVKDHGGRSLHTLQCAAPSPLNYYPFAWRGFGPHLIHSFLGQPESTVQTASRSVQPFLPGSR